MIPGCDRHHRSDRRRRVVHASLRKYVRRRRIDGPSSRNHCASTIDPGYVNKTDLVNHTNHFGLLHHESRFYGYMQ